MSDVVLAGWEYSQLFDKSSRAESAERTVAELCAANATLEQRVRELTAERDELIDKASALSMFSSVAKCKSCHRYYPDGYVCQCGRDNSYSDDEWSDITTQHAKRQPDAVTK